MIGTSQEYDGPAFSLLIETIGGASKWGITLSAKDHSGKTKLGYKAEGELTNIDAALGPFEIRVHDEKRPVWTAMPLSHRPDIRKSIEMALDAAFDSMRAINS